MGRKDFFEEERTKKLITVLGIVFVISVIAFVIIFTIYNKKLKEQADLSVLELGAINSVVPNNETMTTSFSEDKGKNTSNTTMQNTIKLENTTNKVKNVAKGNVVQNKEVKNTNTTLNTVENVTSENIVQNSTSENTEGNLELAFMAPVAGEITKDFANDTLIYSNTLEEWTTHLGIDIKAERTSIVVASEAGTVETIKNDPRYGLTVIINHGNGYQTVYSNLLTTEFVTVGENVEKGQTIATVGDTASFEILDEPHLHFEMYLNGNSVNPTSYLK